MQQSTTDKRVDAVLVTGTIGAGKTALAEEISVVLHERGHQHALVDLDDLGQCYPGLEDDPFNNSLAFANLRAVWPNFLARAVRHAVVANLVETPGELDEIRSALSGVDVTVVRVVASPEVCAERLRRREISTTVLERHLRRSPVLDTALEALSIESFRVSNEGRPIRDVALEVMKQLGWPDARPLVD